MPVRSLMIAGDTKPGKNWFNLMIPSPIEERLEASDSNNGYHFGFVL
ncbi:hypothetical protein [Facklamia miroungae]|nr:hypothetical protein [Facklamia miroungae]NKZ29230.1 hypothetical protein [Facklamia miroungae]